jgi:hypothetical protein
MAISIKRARQLCTAAEIKLVEASTKQNIGDWSIAQLKQKITRASKLTDKWRDLAISQRRASQQRKGSRTTEENARSEEKSQLFREVRERFETRLQRLETGEKTARNRSAARSKTPRSQRAQGHRAVRASTRETLKEKRATWNSSDGSKAATKKNLAPKSATTGTKKKTSASSSSNATGRKKTTRKSSGTKTSERQKRSAQSLKPPKKKKIRKKPSTKSGKLAAGKQRQAATAAKSSRLKTSGVKSRVRGHVSAQGKRSQGRRDRH